MLPFATNLTRRRLLGRGVLIGVLIALMAPPAVIWAVPSGPSPIGRPSLYHIGAPEAYWIWHDKGGYHVRTTTPHRTHVFSGVVTLPSDKFSLIERFGPAHKDDYVRKVDNRIEFSFASDRNVDGFDLWATWPHEATFHLMIDGNTATNRVFIGLYNAHPAQDPFSIEP